MCNTGWTVTRHSFHVWFFVSVFLVDSSPSNTTADHDPAQPPSDVYPHKLEPLREPPRPRVPEVETPIGKAHASLGSVQRHRQHVHFADDPPLIHPEMSDENSPNLLPILTLAPTPSIKSHCQLTVNLSHWKMIRIGLAWIISKFIPRLHGSGNPNKDAQDAPSLDLSLSLPTQAFYISYPEGPVGTATSSLPRSTESDLLAKSDGAVYLGNSG